MTARPSSSLSCADPPGHPSVDIASRAARLAVRLGAAAKLLLVGTGAGSFVVAGASVSGSTFGAASPRFGVRGAGFQVPAATCQQKPPASGPGEPSTPPPAAGSEPQVPTAQAELEELRRRLEVLAAEVERLRSGEEPEQELTEERRRALGLAPSAAAAYRRRHGLSFAGYGELLYENYAAQDQRDARVTKASQLDFLRLVLYSGYRFSDRFVFNSEIELEHANEVSVEFAYIDSIVSDALTVRGGLLLVPMGLINEFHEPTVFVGARRTETETRLLPSTWRENGAGVLGAIGRVSYRAYVMNGLNAAGFTAAGLRGGRQKGSRARADDLAFVGRLDVTPTPGVLVGGSVYGGQSDQGQFTVDGGRLAVGTRIAEIHAQAQARGFDLRALSARAALDDVAGLNRALGLQGSQSIGEVLAGGYVQIGYDLLARAGRGVSLSPFYRFERVNTQAKVPAGFASNPATNATYHTLGVELKPLTQLVVKADYQWISNKAGSGVSQFNVGLGYAF